MDRGRDEALKAPLFNSSRDCKSMDVVSFSFRKYHTTEQTLLCLKGPKTNRDPTGGWVGAGIGVDGN